MQPTTPQMNTVPQYPGATAPFLQVGQSRTDANGAVTTKIADIPTGVSPSTPSTIPLNVATGNVQPVKLPSAPVSGTATSLSSQAGGYLSQPVVTGLNQLGSAAETAGKNLEVAQGDYQSQIKDLLNQMTNRPAQLEGQYNIQGLSADAMKAKANYDSVELGYRRQKEALMTNGAISADQKQANLSELDRKEASQKADIAIDYNLKAGLLSNAKELMNKQIELELEPMKLKADYYKTIKEDYKDVFNTAQNRQIDYLAKKEERAYQAERDKLQFSQQMQLKAVDLANDLKLKGFDLGLSYEELKGIKGVDDFIKIAKGKTKTADTTKMDADSDFKKLKGSADLKQKLGDYQTLVDEIGAQRKGSKNGGRLDAAYQEVLQAYRAAKDLGALQGADLQLVDDAIKRATFEKTTTGRVLNVPLLGIPTAIEKGITKNRAETSITEALDIAQKNMSRAKTIIESKNPNWVNTPYFQSIYGTSNNQTTSVPDTLKASISESIMSGYGNTEIVDTLIETGSGVSDQVLQARNAGWTDEEIINFLNQ